MNEEIEIEYLPKLGEPESIKTIKQGCKGTLSQNINSKTNSDLTYNSYGSCKKIKHPKVLLKVNVLKVLANRIMRFEKSSEKQKMCAEIIFKKTYDFDCKKSQKEYIFDQLKIKNIN